MKPWYVQAECRALWVGASQLLNHTEIHMFSKVWEADVRKHTVCHDSDYPPFVWFLSYNPTRCTIHDCLYPTAKSFLLSTQKCESKYRKQGRRLVVTGSCLSPSLTLLHEQQLYLHVHFYVYVRICMNQLYQSDHDARLRALVLKTLHKHWCHAYYLCKPTNFSKFSAKI